MVKQMVNKERINVYNRNPFNVTASTHINTSGYFWGNAENPNEPTVQMMLMEEIEYIYNNGKSIQNGYLTFKPDEQEEIYNRLGFTNWKDIMSIEEIEDVLLNPTAEKAQKIINLESMGKFERVRAILIGLISTKQYDLSNRIIMVVNKRYEEWLRGQVKSDIIIRTEDVKSEVTENVDALKDKIAKLEAMMMSLANEAQVQKEVIEEKPKKAGRPKKEQVEE